MKEKSYFSDTLKTLAKEQGYTQKALAEKMNVSLDTVKKWYTTGMPDLQKLIQISDIFDVDLAFLIGAQECPRLSEEVATLRNRVEKLEKALREIKNDADLLLMDSGMV